MTPELLILGDSHSIALKEGADLLGIRAEALHFSGSQWHDLKFSYGTHGFEPRGVRAGVQQMRALREKLGVTDVFGMGIPVISTLGFHLGRLVPPFGWNDHRVFEPGKPMDSGLIASTRFAEDYVALYRARHIRTARRLARNAKLVIVAPPPAFDRPNYDAIRGIVTRQLQAAGVTVYDPKDDLLPKGGTLPAELLMPDGVHATAECGAMILQAMAERGLLAA